MGRHKHVNGVEIDMTRLPWNRVVVQGKEHNHTFIRGADGDRFVRATIPRTGQVEIVSGFKNIRIMKTTQSGFEGFIVDEYTTLKDTRDRIMATQIYCEYKFVDNVNIETTPFSAMADSIKKTTIEAFSGPPDTGKYSASVQHTISEIGAAVLNEFPLVKSIKFALPNIHFYGVNFNDFKGNSSQSQTVLLLLNIL